MRSSTRAARIFEFDAVERYNECLRKDTKPEPYVQVGDEMSWPTRAAAWTLRVLAFAMAVAFFVVGYGAWLLGCSDFAMTVWAPFAWMLQRPMDPTLAILLGVLGILVMFFEPAHRFLATLRLTSQGTLANTDQGGEATREENPSGPEGPS